MSDFFTRLAARVLGLSPTLQPIIAPIFAQEQPQGETDLFEILLEEEAPTRSGDGARQGMFERLQAQTSQPVYTPSMDMPLSEQPPALLPTTEEREVSAPIASQPQQVLQQLAPIHMFLAPEIFHEKSIPTATHETQVAHKMPATNGAIYSQKELLITDNAGEEQQVQPVRSLPPIEYNEETPAVDVNLEVIKHRHTKHATIITHQQDNESTFPMHGVAGDRRAMQSPINDSKVTNDGRTPFVPTVINRAATQRNVDLPAVQKQPERPIQPSPTIQVTIGRVEVRANPPSPVPSTSQQTPSPTVKSLDDYLRQREEGRIR